MKIQYDIHNVLYNTMYQRSDFTVLSVETIISADNVHCDVRGEGEEGCDVKIINLHHMLNVACKLPCLALLYVCCTADLDLNL